ncbi:MULTISPECIES: hypothetical protein [Rhizobium]|uniref:hypothetical protein n=1 Tax=Rhizobium TaxID=379 RepID=UPI001B331C5C|nr:MULTISPECIES: hypothetical protein [Rhizobium]MBX4910335.1 hypothetical protein [Rhizobium bangladeshense]MBX5216411.1 hypothetical protein [Rhizobium sp. NLR9a]MBX5223716.1 hypothetical protein [Rhizobium sp. NLR8a]MBX5229314.1 hypothetical protein [Rhizobium sp. NLR9b]MBX5235226.1 hypothetical protein [Rhizobium sp. NLR4a]
MVVIGILHFYASRSTGVEGRAGSISDGSLADGKPRRQQFRFLPLTVRSARSRPAAAARAGISLLVGDVKKRKVALVTLLTSLGEAANDTVMAASSGEIDEGADFVKC